MKGERIGSFLEEACGQIASPKARAAVARELACHMEDRVEQLTAGGMEQEEAEETAVQAMGDPQELAKCLRKQHRPRLDLTMPLLTLMFLALGAAVLWCSPEWTWRLAERFSLYAVLGVVVLFLVRRLDYTVFMRHPYVLYAAACLMPFCGWLRGTYISGHIWIDLGFIAINPAWPMTVLFLLSVAGACARMRGKGLPGLLTVGGMCAVALCFIVVMPEVWAAVILWGSFLAVLLPLAFRGHFGQKGLSIKLIAAVGGLSPLAAVVPLMVHAYRRGSGDPAGGGYLFALVRSTLAEARPWGATMVWPEDGELFPIPGGISDNMLTMVIGTFGWLAGAAAVAAVLFFLIRMFQLSRRIRPPFGRVLARGIFIMFVLRFVSGLLFNLGVFPYGCATPFLAYGGTLTLCDMALLGVFLSVWRANGLMAEEGWAPAGKLLYRVSAWVRQMLPPEEEDDKSVS